MTLITTFPLQCVLCIDTRWKISVIFYWLCMKLKSNCSAPVVTESLSYIYKICNANKELPPTDHTLTHPRTTHSPTHRPHTRPPTAHPLTFLSCFSASCARDSLLERVLSLTMRRVALRERSPIFLLPSSGSEERTSWRACTDNGGIEPYNTSHHILLILYVGCKCTVVIINRKSHTLSHYLMQQSTAELTTPCALHDTQ